MTFLNELRERNQFPIIFIGSGITQRYFENAPTWVGLLKELWSDLDDEEQFYKKLLELKSETNSDFESYLRLADYLEERVNQAFLNGTIEIEGLDFKKVHEENISPFKQLIANKVKMFKRREGFDEEIAEFSKMLARARMIITTNYDTFIEECFDNVKTGIKVNIGNKGLFSKTSDFGELYKIHGSITDVNSISITSKDYNDNESKAPIINAKILSNLVDAPILFFGYSLTDENIRKLLIDFANNSPYDISEASQKIGVVNYKKDESNIIEVISNLSDLSVYYTQLTTDNFIDIYKSVSQIDQGFLPSEIYRYETAFRKIIEVKGADKELKTVLTTYIDLSNMSVEEIRDKNIVVAFGDGRYIYRFPDMKAYLEDYFATESDMPNEIVLGFLEKQPTNSYFPLKKYLKLVEEGSIDTSNKRRSEKLLRLFTKESDFKYDELKSNMEKLISRTHLTSFKGKKTIEEILAIPLIPKQQKYVYIASNIELFEESELRQFVIDCIQNDDYKNTYFRKLLKLYDYLID